MAKYNKAKDKQLRCGLRLPEYLLTKQKGKRGKEKREKERKLGVTRAPACAREVWTS